MARAQQGQRRRQRCPTRDFDAVIIEFPRSNPDADFMVWLKDGRVPLHVAQARAAALLGRDSLLDGAVDTDVWGPSMAEEPAQPEDEPEVEVLAEALVQLQSVEATEERRRRCQGASYEAVAPARARPSRRL